MVEQNLAEISTIRKVVLEHDLTTERDVAAEVVPFLQTEAKRLLKGLDSKSIFNREQRRENDMLTLFNDAMLFKSFCAVSSAARALLTSAVISSTDAPCLLLVNGHADVVQNYNTPLLALFQGSLRRIKVTLNDCDLPRIGNAITVLLCSFCPILKKPRP